MSQRTLRKEAYLGRDADSFQDERPILLLILVGNVDAEPSPF